ncbi:MAG TPA: pyruvate, phosphate dikinase [Jatrophihabitantaceae bacterium]|jgi:pyruvate,orthophosphate dikinase
MSTVQTAPFRWLVVPDDRIASPSRELVGGKAWSLWRMRSLGLRVPPAFVVTTEACSAYFDGSGGLPDGLADELRSGVSVLEAELGRTLGGAARPLLVSVRSGAAVSMPGMMDTILNLGMNADVERALADETGSPEFAADVHRRFCVFYGRLVLGCLDELDDIDSTEAVRAAVHADAGADVPADPWQQLDAAVAAVFASSRSRRAIAYREHHGIQQDLGTAVTVQAMVFGNLDDASGTGVVFSRNPVTGRREPYGEYLPHGQGEDVVSGRITPQPLACLGKRAPEVHVELLAAAEKLDADGRDAQDIEFTVQQGVLYLLQSRPAKRTARAAARIAVELEREGVISADEALGRVTADQVRALLRPTIADVVGARVLAEGVAASPGVATGLAVATPEEAAQMPGAILVRHTTSPEDVHGMIAAAAVVTEHGGSTSHAAVVTRALDTPCVVGCGDGAMSRMVGRVVTVDAIGGKVYDGALATNAVTEDDDPDLRTLTAWARARASVTVLAHAPGPLFDADLLPGLELGEREPSIPPGTEAVAGAYFGTDAGVVAAVAAGVHTIVTPHALPVLLAALAAAT